MSFELTTIGEYATIQGGYAYKSQDFQSNGNWRVLKIKNVRNGYVDYNDTSYVADEIAVSTTKWVTKTGDILISMTGSGPSAPESLVGRVAKVWKGDPPALINQRVGRLCLKDDSSIDKNFLFYLLSLYETQEYLVTNSTGSANQVNISAKTIESVTYPKVGFQNSKQIADILGVLDEHIRLLRDTNATLEAIAQALFKSWFVDFDPVHAKQQGIAPEGMDEATAALFPDGFEESELGLVPRGWKVETIYKVANIIYGAPFASKLFTTEKVGKPLVRIRDLKDETPGIYTEEVLPKGYLIQPGDIVVGMDGEFRAYLWGGEPAWLNQRVCIFAPNQGVPKVFVHRSIVPLLAQVEATETATTVIHLGKNDIDRFKVVSPHKPVLEAFDAITSPLYARVVANKQTAKNLASLRDTLLPRLISGQLKISETESELENAL
ncbi:MAG: restriction endonuclease subunit S [Gallionella sp.]